MEEEYEKYYDSSSLIQTLERTTGKTIDELIETVRNSDVTLTENEIVEYLDKKFEEEEPERKRQVEYYTKKYEEEDKVKGPKEPRILFGEEQLRQIRKRNERELNTYVPARYLFTPHTLTFYKNYIARRKQKALALLSIIKRIGEKDPEIEKEIKEYDIILDSEGNILGADINRLIVPTLYNINDLNKYLNTANDPSTYLTEKIDYLLFKFRCAERYPSKLLQMSINNGRDCIPLSENQKEKQKERLRRSSKAAVKSLINF